MLTLDDVTFSYDKKVNAVEDVTLHVEPGQIVGLLGHNGAGKTTILRLILGLLRPKKGVIKIDGFEPTQPRLPRTLTAYVPETTGIYERLTGFQNLEFRARAAGMERAQIRRQSATWLERLGLLRQGHEKAGFWSKGLRQRLSLACALIVRPRLLLLDEPTVGLDPESLDLMIRILKETHANGTTLVISSHDLHSISELCSHVAILQSARLVYAGPLSETTEQLKRTYLGLTTINAGEESTP
jgi:ABC-type multidrug transport system ATPase subunit